MIFNTIVVFSPLSFYLLKGSSLLLAGIDKQMDHAGSSNWDVVFRPFNDMISEMTKDNSIGTLMAIEYEGLIKATNNFHSDLLLGKGAVGCVYKGWIDAHYLTATKHGRGITVAIKKMNPGGVQGKEFLVCVSSPTPHFFLVFILQCNICQAYKIAAG